MRQLLCILSLLIFIGCSTNAQTVPVGRFHKIIISPYIQVTFIQGDKESVTIEQSLVDSDKVYVEVHGGTLRLYLEGARDFPHDRQHYPLYPKHAVIATVVYRKLDALSLRGEETYLCQSPLSVNRFSLRVYGESRVIFTEAHINRMFTTIYGESSLNIRSGEVKKQHYTCYGEGKINTTAITGQIAKVTAFGEAEFKLNVSDRIRITAFGEAKIGYMGNPDILKFIHIGGVDLKKLD